MGQSPLYIVLLGGPGVGKGTQAALLMRELGLPHVASGDLFRQALKAETALGLEAKGYMARGELVPDWLTVSMVEERLAQPDCAKGAILDGFPRTIEQARALDKLLVSGGRSLSAVLYIKASPETMLRRLGGRWTCKQCQAVYNVEHSPPKQPGRCDVCGGELYQRADDQPETQRKRVDVYLEQTAPLIEHYRALGLLVEIDGEQDIDSVRSQLLEAVGSPAASRTRRLLK